MEILYIIFQQNDMDRQRQYLLVCVVCCRFQLLPIFNLLWKPALIVGDNGQLQHLLGGHPGQTEIGSQQRGEGILIPGGGLPDEGFVHSFHLKSRWMPLAIWYISSMLAMAEIFSL